MQSPAPNPFALSPSQPAAFGGSTSSPALAAPAAPATPMTAGGTASTNVRDIGETSPPSQTDPLTSDGRQTGPPSGSPLESQALSLALVSFARSAFESGAVEVLALEGAGQLITAKHNLDLDSGRWLLVRWPGEGDGEVVGIEVGEPG